MVARVPSMICAEESLRPRYLQQSSDCEDCLLKFLQRIISSVVDCLLKPLAMRISSVVDCLLMAGAWTGGGVGLQGEASLDEQVEELSGDLGDLEPRRPIIEVLCRRSLLRRGLGSRSPPRSGLSLSN